MALLRVRRTVDKVWRCELWHDGWRISQHGFLLATRLTEPQARLWLAEQRIAWDDLIDD